MFLSREVFNKTDGFDTNYDPTCFEDTDLSFQIKALGYKIAYRDIGGIRHQLHQTTKSGSDSHQALFRRNAKYMRNKWATHPDYFLDYDSDAV
jgi:GT2 family glycosyltransferase